MADFNAEPYWDDFEATNGARERNYMRILFRPSYAVQARELTQIQSILQNQIKQFGDHIFQDGSPVIGGHLTLDTSINYVRLNAQFGGSDIDLDDFLGLTVFNTGSPKVRAKVIQTFSSSTDRILLVKYLRGSGFTAGQTISTAGGAQATIASVDFSGTGSVVSINDGVFYADGFFVTVLPQTIVLDAFSSTPTFRIGLEIDEEIITESIDNALLDPAQLSFNYQAPGAHRYQFALNLAKRTLDSVDDRRFFELLRVENGVITKQVSYPIYSELEKTLARRTYDESGNYVVKPFRINLSANTPVGLSENTNTFIVNVEPGKAYVKGFEFETIGTTRISAPRARTTKFSKDYDLSVYYGNRIQLTDVLGNTSGIVYQGELQEVDIHCVPTDGVKLTGNSCCYYATRVGTAKIRNFDRAGSANVFFSYLTDVDFTPIITTVAGNSTNLNSVNLASNFSDVNGAYVGGTVTLVNTTGGTGNSATIINYDGSSKIAVVDRNFSTTVVGGDPITLSMPLATAESFLIANTTSYTSSNLQANVAATSRDALGNTTIEDSSFDRNLFSLPNFYIKYDSDDNVELYRRFPALNQSFAGNGALTVTLTGSDTYDFGTDGSLISNADVSENIIVVARSGANVGQIIDLTTGGRSVFRTNPQSITIYTNSGSGASFTGDVFVTTKLSNAETVRKSKTLIEANTELTVSDTLGSATSVSGYDEVKINTSNGIAWFTSSNVISYIPEEPHSLFISDVVQIKKVYDSGNLSFAPNTTNMTDITDRYSFNSGQNDSYYDHASISLKVGAQPPAGQTAVLFDYFITDSAVGYVSGKSYGQTLYDTEQIPIYKSQNGRLFYLRDCIDLRPIRVSGTTVNPFKEITLTTKVNVSSGGVTVTGNTPLVPPLTTGTVIKIGNDYRKVVSVINTVAVNVSTAFTASSTLGDIKIIEQNYDFTDSITQRPTDSMELDYEYYLPRVDKVVVTKDKEFKILTGVPSLAPQEPPDSEDALTIYTMSVPAYTASLQSVDLNYIENRRYTMKDIAAIDQRLNDLAEYVNLKESENDIINNPPRSPVTPTLNKPVYGTVVDEFDDFSIVDTTQDFATSIENGKLGPYRDVQSFSLEPTNPSDARVRDKFICLPYSETAIVTQALATSDGAQPVQTAMIAKFEGFVTLTPESDYFYSTVHQPSVTDSIGRFFEIPLEGGVSDPALTDSLLENIGGNRYTDIYNNPFVLGSQQFATRQSTIFAPNYSVAATATNNPPITSIIERNIVGHAPETFLNNEWSGAPAAEKVFEPNQFPAGWQQNSYLPGGVFQFDDVGRIDLA
jgi:hypothetical protein